MPVQLGLDWQGVIAVITFATVIFLIAVDAINLTLAAIVGSAVLMASGATTLGRAVDYVAEAHATIALFFGGMVIVRAFAPTRIFEWMGVQVYRLSKGSGKRLLLGIVILTAPICTFLPNATTVLLLAPVLVKIAEYFDTDFAPLLILLVFIANSAGLLTLVGDPASFVVGDAINIGFVGFMRNLTPGGLLAMLVVIVLMPLLFRSIWQIERKNEPTLELPRLRAPFVVIAGGVIVTLEVVFFVVGELLIVPLYPAAVALIGSALALVIVHQSRLDSVEAILRDIDWATLIFFSCVFVLVGAMNDHGVLAYAARAMTTVFGRNLALASIALLFLIGVLSAIVPNIPLVVAMVPLVKGYIVALGLTDASTMSASYTGQFPSAVLPLFYAMMFGATLGGNATLVGASSNLIAGGISAQNGRRITFGEFAGYGLKVTAVQLVVAAAYIAIRFLLPAAVHG
ncbi:MAG: transporter [Deltaproteobacteria bacterium]|nr:transporter [Deltaproteobacteria bacterium]